MTAARSWRPLPITPASILFDQTRYESITPVALDPGQTYHLGVYYSGGGIGLDVAGPRLVARCLPRRRLSVGRHGLSNAGFAFPPEVAGTAGSIYAGPNFRFLSQPTLNIQHWPTNQVRLSWSNAYSGFTLQSELGLSGSWADAGLSVTTVSNQFVAFDAIGLVPKYYRLSK